MKISLIVLNLSSNPIVRAYPIAKVLQRHFEVEILGLYFSDALFPAYQYEFEYLAIPAHRFPNALKALNALYKFIDGDIVYAFKPRLTTFGVGLLAKSLKRTPLILDIEDFEIAPLFRATSAHRVGLRIRKQFLLEQMFLKEWRNPLALRYRYVMDKLTGFADCITVASSFLQKRYGGTKIIHGADTTFFDPVLYDGGAIRKRLGIAPGRTVILFTGTPRGHKGLTTLAEAISTMSIDYGLLLMIVGDDRESTTVKELRERYGDIVLHIESQPHELMPYFLSAADLIVLPQRDTFVSQAQIPGKLFEAMSMGKPIIASAVSDIPEILSDCGIVFAPGHVDELSRQIARLCQDPSLAMALGAKARQKCLNHYSWDALEDVLLNQVLARWL